MNAIREDIAMKKLLVFILALCLVTGLCGCQVITKEIIERDAAAADDTTLYEHGMELAELLEEMLGSPEYFEMMSGSERLEEDSIEGVRGLFSYLDAEGMHIKKLETD